MERRSSHFPSPFSIFLLSFLFFFFFFISCNALSPDRKFNSPSSYRTLSSLQRRRDQQISNCGEKVSALQCSQTPKCRWCRSDVIDDTCFTRAEALRLPQQVIEEILCSSSCSVISFLIKIDFHLLSFSICPQVRGVLPWMI